jgi:DNA-binding GntR family transcriptional regulator
VLADEVADTIREAIFSGRIDLGQRLIEEDLATMLKVSRGPVREPSHS